MARNMYTIHSVIEMVGGAGDLDDADLELEILIAAPAFVGEWGAEFRDSRLEAWMKSHKSEVAITFICTPTNQETV